MIAVDSSTIISFAQGETGIDVTLFQEMFLTKNIILPPAVIAEVTSNPHSEPRIQHILEAMKSLNIISGYWQRAGLLRSTILRAGKKARLGDTLIAQSCIDHGVPLITRDSDFNHYAEYGALELAL